MVQDISPSLLVANEFTSGLFGVNWLPHTLQSNFELNNFLHMNKWLVIFLLCVFTAHPFNVSAKTYEETINVLRSYVDIPPMGLGKKRAKMDEQLAAIIKQWSGYADASALQMLLLDLSSEKYRHQAQVWMFNLHAAKPSVKGDMLAEIIQNTSIDDSRRRLLFIADPRYLEDSKYLRWVMVKNLDDKGTTVDFDTGMKWPMRNRLQSVLNHYLNTKGLSNENNDILSLSAYMDPAYEDDAINRTKRLIAANPELFAAPDSSAMDKPDNVIKDDKNGRVLATQNPIENEGSEANTTTSSPSPYFISLISWSLAVTVISGLFVLRWLLKKKNSGNP